MSSPPSLSSPLTASETPDPSRIQQQAQQLESHHRRRTRCDSLPSRTESPSDPGASLQGTPAGRMNSSWSRSEGGKPPLVPTVNLARPLALSSTSQRSFSATSTRAASEPDDDLLDMILQEEEFVAVAMMRTSPTGAPTATLERASPVNSIIDGTTLTERMNPPPAPNEESLRASPELVAAAEAAARGADTAFAEAEAEVATRRGRWGRDSVPTLARMRSDASAYRSHHQRQESPLKRRSSAAALTATAYMASMLRPIVAADAFDGATDDDAHMPSPLLKEYSDNDDRSDDSLSSVSSLAEEDVEKLANTLAKPRARGKIFRSIRNGVATPTNMMKGRRRLIDDADQRGNQDRRHQLGTQGGESELKSSLTVVSSRTDTNDGHSDDPHDDMLDLRQCDTTVTFKSVDFDEEAITLDSDRRVQNIERSRRGKGRMSTPRSGNLRGRDRSNRRRPSGEEDSHTTHNTGLFTYFRPSSYRTLAYMSAFAIFGTSLRVYLARLFGADCEDPDVVHDFLTPLSKQICVTSTGRTEQTGGALFIDLPANMLGSFVLGVITGDPWLKSDHPAQSMMGMHVAVKVGLCGSLTTFASWNTQMVVMMDGTDTVLGSQVLSALFGYVVGLCCAIGSYVFGRQVSIWLNRWKNPGLFESHEATHTRQERRERRIGVLEKNSSDLKDSDRQKQKPPPIIVLPSIAPAEQWCCRRKALLFVNFRTVPFILVVCLLLLYLVGDTVMDIPFYRSMWLAVLITPPGAILRWKLSLWNGTLLRDYPKWKWFPVGTFTANIVGSLLSVALVAMESRLIREDHEWTWAVYMMKAAKVGFAGSLSTVSTLAKEIVDISAKYPMHAKALYYAFCTIVCSCMLCLCLYSPIVRGT